MMRASFQIEDEDLEDAALRIQPALTENWPATTWDKNNYISRGGVWTKATGLASHARWTRRLQRSPGLPSPPPRPRLRSPRRATPIATSRPPAHGPSPQSRAGPAACASPWPAARRRDSHRCPGIVGDMALCSFSIPYGDAFDISS